MKLPKKYLLGFDSSRYPEFQENFYLYRYMPVRRFVEVIESQTLTFVKPSKWDDPFENFILKLRYKDPVTGNITTFKDLEQRIVGLCFTTIEDNDFAWRVFGESGHGVMLKFDTNRLISFLKKLNKIGYFSYRKVNYKEVTEIIASYKSNSGALLNNLVYRDDLFLKRIEFEHEKEFRILYEKSSIMPDTFKLKFDLGSINEVLLGPKMSIQSEICCRGLLEKFKFKGEVNKSTLWDFPEIEPLTLPILSNIREMKEFSSPNYV